MPKLDESRTPGHAHEETLLDADLPGVSDTAPGAESRVIGEIPKRPSLIDRCRCGKPAVYY